MKDNQPKAIQLSEYTPPEFYIAETSLEFDLHEEYTIVTATLSVLRNADAPNASQLSLHGQELELLSVELNQKLLSAEQYELNDDAITLFHLVESNTIVFQTKIYPHKNTALEGLYRSNTMYCTQCEAEGFRKITYYLDRPDVMSVFTTKITADKSQYPILLSNGNKVEEGELNDGRHFVTWHDPHKKPSYLFALVAGDLEAIDDTFTTQSGREVLIRIFVEEKDLNKCDHAIQSLKNAMSWDEKVYGREYDLDIFMIVAVDDFNMGAMENKGLNIFNTSCVLANKSTTTDAGFQRVEGVVAHEYFHNWSGNRVTCRDWFQLSLKEGFTVFRDAEFSADMNSRTVKRIEDVSLLRTHQFSEDAGPMAHPVRPASFIEISNFYTMTIYEKGAEVVRMIYNMLGSETFRKGSDLYFSRHDGQAVTVEDFVQAMADVSNIDFTQFMSWYSQAGTPELTVSTDYDETNETYTIRFKQSCRPTPETENKQPYVIPVAMGLLGENGEIPLIRSGADNSLNVLTHDVLIVDQPQQTFVFEEVSEKPVPSLLRGFSAPVKLKYRYSRDDYARLMMSDTDGFNRWEASQNFAIDVIRDVMARMVEEPAPSVDDRLLNAYQAVLADKTLDPAMVALMLQLPSEQYLGELAQVIDVEAIYHARNRVERKVATRLYDELLSTYTVLNSPTQFDVSSDSIAKRSLKNTALHYLVLTGREEAIDLAKTQFYHADNMTDESAAFSAIVHSSKSSIEGLQKEVIDHFYQKWSTESLVVNQWFAVQATKPVSDVLQRVKNLMEHEAFDSKNPNKIRALIGGFAMRNPIGFHSGKGVGYEFLTDRILELNQSNPQIASRLLTPLTQWQRYDENRQVLMKKQLQRISAVSDLSKDVYEVVTKSLGE